MEKRLVALSLCGACYYKHRSPQRLPTTTELEESYVENTYEMILIKKSANSSYISRRYKEYKVAKTKIVMIPVGACLICSAPKTNQRYVEGKEIDLCHDHYQKLTYGQLARVLKGEDGYVDSIR